MKFALMNQAGGDGAASGAAGGAGAAGAAGAGAAGAAAGAAAQSWHSGYDADTKGFLANKGWDKLETPDKALPEIIRSFRDTEKFIGAPSNELLRLPKDADDKTLNGIYDRLGRPSEPKGYGLKHADGTDPKFVEASWAAFHKAGLNPKQAQGIVDWFTGYMGESQKATDAAYNVAVEAETAKLKQEWGAAGEKNEAVAKEVFKMLSKETGIDGKFIDAMEKAVGYAQTMKFFHKLGAMFGEDRFIGAGGGKFGDAKSAQAAQSEIDGLKNDAQFKAKLMSGDTEAKKRWDRLHEQAAGIAA